MAGGASLADAVQHIVRAYIVNWATRPFAMQSAKSGELAEDIFEEKSAEQNKAKTSRLCTYLLISWTIQFLCVILVILGLLWGIVQILRLTNFLGVSQEPPGLTYYIDVLDPTPAVSGI